jgi:predicted flap endonuclease-1-like 5' DNA nuclease
MYLLSQLWTALLLIGLLGGVIGFFVRKVCARRGIDEKVAAAQRAGQAEAQRARVELNAARGDYRAREEALQAQLAEVTTARDASATQATQQLALIGSRDRELAQRQSELAQRDTRLQELQQRFESEVADHVAAKNRIAGLIAAAEAAESSRRRLVEERDASVHERELRIVDLERRLQSHAAQHTSATQRATQLQGLLDGEATAKQRLVEERDEAVRETEALQQRLAAHDRDLRATHQKLVTLEPLLAAATARATDRDGQVMRLTSERQTTEQTVREREAALQAELARLREAHADELNRLRQAQQGADQAAATARTKMQDELRLAQTQALQLTQARDAAQRTQSEAQQALAAEQAQSRAAAERAQLQAREREGQLQEQHARELTGLREQVAALQARLRTADERHGAVQLQATDLQTQLAQWRERADRAGADLTQRDGLHQAELTRVRNLLSDTQAQHRAADEAQAALRAQLGELDQRAKSREQREQQLQADVTRLQRESDELRERFRTSHDSASQLRQQAADQKARADHFAAELADLREDQAAGRKAAQAAEASAAERERRLAAEIAGLRSELEAARQQRAQKVSPAPQRSAPVVQLAASMPAAPSRFAKMDAAALEKLVLAAGEGRKPNGTQRAGKVDNLQLIDGIGPVNERWLHRTGIYHFWQIAQWTPDELAWVAHHLPNFGTRVYRENWVAQAAKHAQARAVSA